MRTIEDLECYGEQCGVKIGFISDSHFAIHRRNNIFFPHMKKMVELFLEECHNRKVDFVIHTGDLFDTKHIISTEGLILTNELIEDVSKEFPIIIIPGNHDFAHTEDATYNLASNYKNHNNVYIIEQYTKLVLKESKIVLHFLPYEKYPAKSIKKIVTSEKKYEHYLCSHIGISGFKMHENASQYANQISAQLNIPDLKKFSKVFTGHYHGFQTGANIIYISAPLQSKHGDENSRHGFVFLDSKKNSVEFCENKYTPQFITYSLTKKNVQKMLTLKNHYIRIFVKKKVSVELLTALKRKLIKNNYDVMIDFDITDGIKFAVIEGWKDFVMKDPDNLIINYLDLLEKNNELPFEKINLLKLLGINVK